MVLFAVMPRLDHTAPRLIRQGFLLSLLIMADSVGQFFGPVLGGRILQATHIYDLARRIITTAGILGAAAIYAVRTPKTAA